MKRVAIMARRLRGPTHESDGRSFNRQRDSADAVGWRRRCSGGAWLQSNELRLRFAPFVAQPGADRPRVGHFARCCTWHGNSGAHASTTTGLGESVAAS